MLVGLVLEEEGATRRLSSGVRCDRWWHGLRERHGRGGFRCVSVRRRSFGQLQDSRRVATGSDLLASGDGKSSRARGIPVVARHEQQRRREPMQGSLSGGAKTGSDLLLLGRSSGKVTTAVLSRHERRRRCEPAE